MKYAIKVLKRAEKDLAAVPVKEQEKIFEQIEALADDPKPQGCKPMKGGLAGHFRVRVGPYRIVYKIEKTKLVIVIVRIGHRREVYRNL